MHGGEPKDHGIFAQNDRSPAYSNYLLERAVIEERGRQMLKAGATSQIMIRIH